MKCSCPPGRSSKMTAITKNRKLEGENCYFRHDQSTLYLTCSFYICCESVVNKYSVNYKMKEMCMYC